MEKLEEDMITFRVAEARDALVAVPMMYSSGVELYDYNFLTRKTKATDFIHHEFLNGEGMMGHKNHTVAIYRDEVVGIGAFYSGRDLARLSKGTGKNIFKYFGVLGALRILYRAKDSASLMMRPGLDEQYVANFGVREDMRGKSIGTALLTHEMEKAKNNSFSTYALDVATNNPRAQTLYERFGFKVTKEKKFTGKRKGHVVPDARQMEMSLVSVS